MTYTGSGTDADNNTYEYTNIALKTINLSIKDNQTVFDLGEDVVLNYSIALKNPRYYDEDITEKLDDITIYVNGAEHATTGYENYTLSISRPGKYNVYYKTCNQESNTVTFKVKSLITNWQQLSEAVDDAKDETEDVTIYLGEGNYTNTATITWTNPDTVLTIEGEGQTIDGNQLQVFKITDGASLVLRNITITGAKSKYGGAIRNYGTLEITDSTLANNTATEEGGAVYSNGTLTIINSTLENNTAEWNAGAIYNEENLNITDSTLSDNRARNNGGAVYNFDMEYYNIAGSKFTGNHARCGGAVYSYGYANLTGNTFVNNTADNGETIDLYNYNNGRFDNNIYESTDISLKTCNLSIRDNQSIFNPGEGIVLNYSIALNHTDYYDKDIPERLDDITIYINDVENVTTGYENYTLYNLKPGEYTVYYTTCNHKSNTVNFTVTPITNWQQLSEAVHYAEVQKTNITLTLQEGDYTNTGTITWNNRKTVLTIDGNGQTVDGNQLQAFCVNDGASLVLRNITIQDAKSDNGGAIENWGTLTITDSVLVNNAANEDGGAIFNNGTLKITDSTLASNTANDDAGAIFNNGTLIITDSVLASNTANDDAGAIYNRESLTITQSAVDNNHADSYGGAICSYGTVTVTQSTVNNNNALTGGAISSINGILTVTQSTLNNNTVSHDGGAIYNHGTLTITDSTLSDNTANNGGGAIINKIYRYFNVARTNFTNNHANEGGAIRSPGYTNFTGNTFTNNTADNGETIYLLDETGRFNADVYESTDILLKNLNLSIRDNQTLFNKGEDVVLNYSIALEHPDYYDADILERLDDITIYINDMENVTTGYENYTLSDLSPGEYTAYIKTCNQESNTVAFKVGYVNLTTEVTPTHLIITARDHEGNPVTDGTITTNLTEANYTPDDNGQVFIPLTMKGGEKCVNISYTDDTSRIKSSINVTFDIFVPSEKINVTTWDVEMVQGKGVTFSALVYEKNKTVNYGKVYFTIDDKPILDENGSVLYVPVKDSRADLSYDMPSDVALGNHTLSAVFIKYVTAWNKDDKTLTIIENIPEGAGDKNETPSEDGKQERYNRDTTRPKTMTKYAKATQQVVSAGHRIVTDSSVIAAGNVITLGELNEMFNQTFTNGHLLVYMDGEMVYNGTVGDDLTTVILEIIEKFLGDHEIRVEFTDKSNET